MMNTLTLKRTLNAIKLVPPRVLGCGMEGRAPVEEERESSILMEEVSLEELQRYDNDLAKRETQNHNRLIALAERDAACKEHEDKVYQLVQKNAKCLMWLYENHGPASGWESVIIEEREHVSGKPRTVELWKRVDKKEKENPFAGGDANMENSNNWDPLHILKDPRYYTYRAKTRLAVTPLRVFKLNDDNRDIQRRRLWDDKDIELHMVHSLIVHHPNSMKGAVSLSDFITITDTIVNPPVMFYLPYWNTPVRQAMRRRRLLGAHWRQRTPGRWTMLTMSLPLSLRCAPDGTARYPPVNSAYEGCAEVDGFVGLIVDDVADDPFAADVTLIAHIDLGNAYLAPNALYRYEQKLLERFDLWEQAGQDQRYWEMGYDDKPPLLKGKVSDFSVA